MEEGVPGNAYVVSGRFSFKIGAIFLNKYHKWWQKMRRLQSIRSMAKAQSHVYLVVCIDTWKISKTIGGGGVGWVSVYGVYDASK